MAWGIGLLAVAVAVAVVAAAAAVVARSRVSATYGSSASSRARLTAGAIWFWCRRHAPVMRRERILPRSEMNLRRAPTSL